MADRLTAVTTEIAECEVIGEALADRLGHREITLAAFDKANQSIAADLARLGAERDALAVGEPVGPVAVLDATSVAAQWDDAEPPERRALLIAALRSLRLALNPAPQGGGGCSTRPESGSPTPHSAHRAGPIWPSYHRDLRS